MLPSCKGSVALALFEIVEAASHVGQGTLCLLEVSREAILQPQLRSEAADVQQSLTAVAPERGRGAEHDPAPAPAF